MSTKEGGIRIVGKSVRVVEHDGLTIVEAIGNVATKNDDLSLALVTIAGPTSEPWLTLHYDEYIHVTEGYVELHQEDKDDGSDETVTRVEKGETVFIPKGSRMRPVFPVAASYIPICLPAFTPERCVREEGTEISDVSARLDELHKNCSKNEESALSAEEVNRQFDRVRRIYHMCQRSLYEEARASRSAYFPPTFVKDGRFTHATAVPASLIATANHFYTSTKGDWICLELSRDALEIIGIATVFESAKPVGDIDAGDDWKDSVFPHVFGGIPVQVEGVVTKVYDMKRAGDGTFLTIDGLVER